MTTKQSRLKPSQKDSLFGMALMIPAVLVLGLVILLPIVKGIWMSFCDYTITSMKHPVWNNFENYRQLFRTGEIFTYFGNTIVFVAFVVAIQFLIAMSLALLLNTKLRGRNFFRGIFLISWTVPSVVVALLWSWMLQPQYGVLNYLFYHLGIISDPHVQWVQSVQYAMPSIVAATVWKQTPYMLVMILAGLQSISKDYMEAAKIDGANGWQIFRRIMIPSIRPVLNTTLLISIMNNFQMYTIIYNMTAGGPMNKTTTLSIAAYTKAFTEYDLGAGSAIGVLWLLVLAIFTVFYNKRANKNQEDYM